MAFEGGDSNLLLCSEKLRLVFKHFQLVGDKKAFIILWRKDDFRCEEPIESYKNIPNDLTKISMYIPRLFVKQGSGRRLEYLFKWIGHYESFVDIKRDI